MCDRAEADKGGGVRRAATVYPIAKCKSDPSAPTPTTDKIGQTPGPVFGKALRTLLAKTLPRPELATQGPGNFGVVEEVVDQFKF